MCKKAYKRLQKLLLFIAYLNMIDRFQEIAAALKKQSKQISQLSLFCRNISKSTAMICLFIQSALYLNQLLFLRCIPGLLKECSHLLLQ